ncbi:TonB-dependent siderophore receptor [Lampropedia puyangensis]|uniref:TonB-dependent siderophore receptor n=2 Tax=Lampropedia puyangensis TaxID=1330072 RepID=A0A4S8FIV7_9BURK|nr:TonB-dependent siderophore receptor [Lampropedia puyangensis]
MPTAAAWWVAVAVATMAAPTHAQQAVAFDIPAQPLAGALRLFSQQARQQVLFDQATVAGRSAPAVRGSLTPRQALDQLLAGTGIVLVQSQPDAFTLKAAPVANPQAAPATLEMVTVTVQPNQETATGPVGGLVAKRSATGSKTDTPIIETPQSISVIPAEQIELLKPRDIAETLAYTAGISRSAWVDRVVDEFVVRGFTSTQPYLDGMRYQVGIYDGQMEPYGLERVEVLKGAASTLYGSLPPGGLINAVSKQPTTEPLHEIGLDVGSFKRRQLSADFGGALTEDEAWSYRLTTVLRKSDTAQDYINDDRKYLAGALRWRPSAVTSLTLRAEFQHDATIYTAGTPLYGTLLPSSHGEIPTRRFIGEPGFDTFKVNRKVAGYLLEHDFSDDLKLRHGLRYYQGNIHRREAWARNYYGFTSDQRTITRRGHERFQTSKGVTMDTSLQYTLQTGAVQHTAIAGLDYSRITWNDQYYHYDLPDLDIFSPVYGSPIGAQRRSDDNWGQRNTKQTGLYVQDQMKMGDRWVVMVGGRQDYVRFDNYNPLTGAIEADNEKSSKFSGRLGVVYLAPNGLAPFVGFSQSFQPQTGSDRTGARFKPTEGEQYEAGVRYQPTGSDTLITAAVYQLTQTNVTVSDPFDSSFSVQMGKVRSRGFELEARTRLGRHANLIGAYAYTDARTIKSSPLTPSEEGKRFAYTPPHQLSAWADYGFGAFDLPGLRVGAGARYTGTTREQGSTQSLPAYVLMDAMVSYSTGPWKLALNMKNLADKRYVTTCSYNTCFLGEPRTVILTAAYRW